MSSILLQNCQIPYSLLPPSPLISTVACARVLLESGADPNLRDSTGSCALNEACKSGLPPLIDELLRHGAQLNMDASALAGQLCRAVFEGDMKLLNRMVHAGANVAVSDYDGRTVRLSRVTSYICLL